MTLADERILDSLFAKLTDILGAPDTITDVKREEAFVSFTRPGIPIPEEALDFGFVTMSADQNALAADFADFANEIPTTSGFWNPTGRKVDREYWKIIDAPQLPNYKLTDDEVERLGKAQEILWKTQQYQDPMTGGAVEVIVPSLLVERYKEYEARWDEAFLRYQTAFQDFLLRKDIEPLAAEIWAQQGPVLKKRVERAYQEWASAGKGLVDQARATVDNLERRGTDLIWADRRRRFRSHTRDDFQGGEYQLTKYFPQKFWLTSGVGSAWLNFTFGHKEVHEVDKSKKESFGGGGSIGFGLWSFGAGYNRSTIDTYSRAEMEEFSLSLELAKVPLRRTWLDASVFYSRSWRLDPQLYPPSENLSDGGDPPNGTMTILPTALLFVRNIKLHFNKTDETNAYHMEKVKASGSVGWGPFSIRGSYSKETEKRTHDYVEDSRGLQVPGMQAIGFVCTRLPKCPNPDVENLDWPE